MDTLPSEILFYNIYPFLERDSINLALTCWKFYSIYVQLRDSNELIAKRFVRVNGKCTECLNNNKEGIVLDRMYRLYPYHESEIFLIFVKTWTFCSDLDKYSIVLRYTKNKWVSHNDFKRFKPIDQCNYKNSYLIETTWLIDIFYPDVDIWFALQLKYYCNNIEWDNNGGWNYDILHDHIPCFYSCDKYPISDFWYNNVISDTYSSLNEWLYYWTQDKYIEECRKLNNQK